MACGSWSWACSPYSLNRFTLLPTNANAAKNLGMALLSAFNASEASPQNVFCADKYGPLCLEALTAHNTRCSSRAGPHI